MGALSPEQNAQFLANPQYAGFKFPEISSPETLLKKYSGKIPYQALDLMTVCAILVR